MSRAAPRSPSPSRASVPTPAGFIGAFAERGLFRAFSRRSARAGRERYRFFWHREDAPCELTFDPRRGTLTFNNLLSHVPPRSPMDRELRRYLASLSAARLPEHRRVDPRRCRLRVVNRKGSVSLSAAFRPREAAYAARKLILAVDSIFHDFLFRPLYLEYRIRHLNAPED